MKGFKWLIVATCLGLAGWSANSLATTKNAYDAENDLLIKLADDKSGKNLTQMIRNRGGHIESIGTSQWVRIRLTAAEDQGLSMAKIRSHPSVLAVQPNYKLRLLTDYRIKDPKTRALALSELQRRQKQGNLFRNSAAAPKDNPEIPGTGSGGSGADPFMGNQWGMLDMGLPRAWDSQKGYGVVVAVIDTGVDYTHEDLVDNLWRNPGEWGVDAQGKNKASNGVDDDGNGFVDDSIGWDFVSNDEKPFDLSVDPIQLILKGGNPGHGTHCAGNVAARAENGKGIAGVAPNARIMVLRFLSEKGEGDTVGAIKSIQYAVRMGAHVLSNSWGSEGEDPSDPSGNQALKDAIQEAQQAGVLFVAAAGNGHQGLGYDNDSDSRPAYPASYPHENIVSVAALDSSDQLGSFSNWGAQSVDLGAPGVKVFSTTVGGQYSDTVLDLMGIKVTWDGTSMATPHVAGAAALYWAHHPTANWYQVKQALLGTALPMNSMSGKSVSGGKLNLDRLMAN